MRLVAYPIHVTHTIDKPAFARPGGRCEAAVFALRCGRRIGHRSRTTIGFGCEPAAPSMSGSWPDSRWFGMRSARRRASGALDHSCLDLGLCLSVLLGLPFERAGRPFGLGRLRLRLLVELFPLPA